MFAIKNKALLTLFIVLLWGIFSELNAQIITNGLAAYYPFNGNANDESGHGHHGTVMNGAYLTTDRFGSPNRAYFFDGIDDFIEVPNSLSFFFTHTLTLSAWINQNLANQYGPRILDKHIATIPDGGFSFDTYGRATDTAGRGHTLRFLNCRVGANWEGANSAFTLNVWHHLVVTYSYGVITYYLDGVADGIINDGTLSLDSNSLTLRIGAAHNSSNDCFHGKIDDIGIFNRVLTPSEIMTLYNDNTSSVQELNEAIHSFTVYPNPTNEILNLHFKNVSGKVQFFMINTLGQIVYSEKISETGDVERTIHLEEFAKGMYFVQVQFPDAILSKKIILE